MPTTFLDLTNTLLRRLNEVPIAQSDFAGVRGVQSVAKDAIIASIEGINKSETEWPFNAAVGTQALTKGTQDYTFPPTLRSVKWDTFYVVKNPTLNINTVSLDFVSRDYWDKYHKITDYDSTADGLSIPRMVFASHGFGFTVSPVPNENYTVKFEYFLNSPALVDYNDQSTIPSVYDEVIIQGAIYHFYMFRSNADQASMAEGRYRNELETMQRALISREDTIRSTMIVKNSPTHGVPTGYMYG